MGKQLDETRSTCQFPVYGLCSQCSVRGGLRAEQKPESACCSMGGVSFKVEQSLKKCRSFQRLLMPSMKLINHSSGGWYHHLLKMPDGVQGSRPYNIQAISILAVCSALRTWFTVQAIHVVKHRHFARSSAGGPWTPLCRAANAGACPAEVTHLTFLLTWP